MSEEESGCFVVNSGPCKGRRLDPTSRKLGVFSGKQNVFGLLGTNGCGKSSLFKMMLGMEPVTSGRISLLGCDTERDMDREGENGGQNGLQ